MIDQKNRFHPVIKKKLKQESLWLQPLKHISTENKLV